MAGVAGDNQLFEDSFTVINVDQSKYDRVARLKATSDDNQTLIYLDINTELYPCQVGDRLDCVLASSLKTDGSKDDEGGWRDATKGGNTEGSLADLFDYVCHGKIYKFEDGADGQSL